MKLLHSADIHVGASRFLPDYLQRQEKGIDAIFKTAKDQGITIVCVCGDIFDSDCPTREERDMVQKKLIGYDQAGFIILMIPGNHDLADMRGYTAIHYLSLLHNQGKFINSTITEKTTYRLIGDTLFILLCHTPKQFKKDYQKAIDDAKNSSIQFNYKNIVILAHETIKGSITDTNWRLKGGEEVPVLDYGETIEEIDNTIMLLGDLHIKQKLAPRVYYSGSPWQIKFGDQYPKGVLLWDTEDPDNPQFIPIESKQMMKVTDLENIPEDCYVKIITNKIDALGVDLPENVHKIEYVKEDLDIILDLSKDLSLHKTILENISKILPEPDMIVANKELNEIMSEVKTEEE